MDDLTTVCHVCGAKVLDIDVRCGACGAGLTSTGAQRRIGSVVLENYQVTEVLGQGGMSVVYRGKHKLTEQDVALKILPPELAAYAHVKTRFVEEARALAQLDHPNIVHLYNFGQDDDCFVLAMQFVQGKTWERMIVEQGKLDWRTSCKLALDVARALEYAHSRGIVHRDMKPSNVLVRQDGVATVMDFGIAKMTTSSRLTATGQTMGTVRYMSPEQVRGGEVDARTDLYSLAVTLYESLAGDTPFDGDSHFEIMTAHLSKPAPPIEERVSDVPPALAQLIASALAKAPGERPASATVFREALEAIVEGRDPGLPSPARDLPTAAITRGRRAAPRIWLALAALVAAGGAGTATWMIKRRFTAAATAGDAGTLRPVAVPPVDAWPQPFALADLRFAVDETFAADRVRIQSVSPRPADALRRQYVAAQDRFFALLGEGGVAGVERQPLNVVVVPRSVLCDRRIYERGVPPDDCTERSMALRPFEKTLFLADIPERLAIDLADGAATNVCLQTRGGACETVLESYLAELDLSTPPAAPKK